ncbi:MAG: methylmalonyl-CoA carboxyltransferase, partial [Rhodospirillales bacterium]|nr:methylmalonyl-CoA carboxyltransferase [Rhodospirillales bacterium]
MAERLEELRERRDKIHAMGGPDRIEKQHNAGKLDARERVTKLLDEGSFQEQNAFAKHRCINFGMEKKDIPADGVVTGCGAIDGRLVHIASQDFTSVGGASGEVHCDKIVAMMKGSLKTGSPLVYINDSGGARIQ